MRSSTMLVGTMAQAALAAIEPKNFIFIIPDGLSPASQTLLRTYLSETNGSSTPDVPSMGPLPLDTVTLGTAITHSYDDLVTDSAAAGTALATGFKTENGALGVLPDGKPIGNILEAAKHAGLTTALVVTSIINHATPAAFSAHINDRDAYDSIAEQQVGYSNALNQSVDILLGGGRCYFLPQSDPESCREDDIDLFEFAADQGYTVARDRADFDDLEGGLGDARLPYLGLFNDDHLSYEIDRQAQPEDEREPSLSELTETALNALGRETGDDDQGFFLMIEASRVDHSSHANDPAAHVHDVHEFNNVAQLVMDWIDEHPDTAMIAVADHETGGLSLPEGYLAAPLAEAEHSTEYLFKLWEDYDGDDREGFLVDEILAPYGITDASEEEIDALLDDEAAEEEEYYFENVLANVLNNRTSIEWSTDGHSAVDVTIFAYAAGEMGDQLKLDLAGNWDNTDLPRYVEASLGLDIDEITALLRTNGTV